jgi:uncharacterized membrane protein HdeD (DUF308 family)
MTVPDSTRLRNLYAVRVAFSLGWVALVLWASASLAASDRISVLAGVLLIGYPVSDALATFVELRTNGSLLAHRVNLMAAACCAGGVAIALFFTGVPRVVTVFGGWAVISGGVQALLALRRAASMSGQWFLLVSGVGSVVAGLTYLSWTGPGPAALRLLAQYSAGGALWYAVAVVRMTLASSLQRPQHAAVDGDDDAGQVGRGRGQQERSHQAELFRLAKPSQRDVVRAGGRSEAAQPGRVDAPREQTEHPDTAGSELVGQGLRIHRQPGAQTVADREVRQR